MNDLEELISHIENEDQPNIIWSDLVHSLWWAKKGNWEKAHNIAQDIENCDGAWVHAYLHRVEGDMGNAEYWYRRAGQPSKTNESLDEEWLEITRAILQAT